MRNYMYLRPGSLYKDFVIEENTGNINENGRVKTNYDESGIRMLCGVLAEADDRQKEKWKQLQHPITHIIKQDGKPKAKAEDRLILGNRVFYIQGVDDSGGLGICTFYYAEERFDLK